MILFSPMPSSEHMGHYCTILEMCGKQVSELTSLDDGMPSAESGFGLLHAHTLPDYICPSFYFTYVLSFFLFKYKVDY